MTETLQLDAIPQLCDPPRLLVEWSSPWEDFLTSIRPALARSDPRLAGEAPVGLRPLGNLLAVCAAEAFVIFLAIIIPIKLDQLHPYIAPKLTGHDIIYYSGDELPRTEDLGGTHAGASGTAGGTEAHHRTQTIRVARGGSMVEKVLDAPRLKLSPSPDAVANLLAIRPDAGPPPTEGMRSERTIPNLPSGVIAPAPTVSRDRVLVAPALTPSVVAPAPTVSRDRVRTAPLLTTSVVPPAPQVVRDQALVAPSLSPRIIAPAPSLDASANQSRSAPALRTSVVPPAPAVSRDISRPPVQMINTAVVAPPVSAPERETMRKPNLAMPAPAVVAPPPSISQETHLSSSGSVLPPATQVVPPPPPAPATNTSFVTSLLNRVFGGPSASPAVVAPPPTLTASASSRASSTSLTANVVPPPPSLAGGSQTSSAANRPLLAAKVVPPPPSPVATAGRSAAMPAVAANVVPPPPSLGKGDALAGAGRGVNGAGLAASMNGSVLAPPRNAGSGADSGVVVSKDPGPKVGLPANAKPGSIAMSPAGADKPGLGGPGGGSGLVTGKGTGSALNGGEAGGGKTGADHGSDPAAKAGISPTPGPGGAGVAPNGTPAVPGVSVTGGSSMITVDMGSNIGSGNPNLPGRSSVKGRQTLGITVQSTASSGGAFDFYHLMPDATSHDVYIFDTALPTVMRYSDPAATRTSGALAGPEPLHTDLPSGLPRSRLVITCVLDASGSLKNLHVYEAGPADMTAKVMAALQSWKFSPAMLGNQPVEVNAILGFNIDTNDRR